MRLEVRQRPDWNGTPIGLGELFLLREGRPQGTRRAVPSSRRVGVRLQIGSQLEGVQTQVCRDQQGVHMTVSSGRPR
jgi:hypothetical protein